MDLSIILVIGELGILSWRLIYARVLVWDAPLMAIAMNAHHWLSLLMESANVRKDE